MAQSGTCSWSVWSGQGWIYNCSRHPLYFEHQTGRTGNSLRSLWENYIVLANDADG